MTDHATGVAIGEMAVVEDDVSIMYGVLLSMGAKILGNIEVGECSRVGASSVVLHSAPPGCTAASSILDDDLRLVESM
jgi:serine O-acetyltransferase